MALEEKVKSKGNFFINYFQESFQELKKVTWPTRNQAVRLTFLVLGFCLVTTVIVGLLDYALSYGNQTLIDLAPQAVTSPSTVTTPSASTPIPISGATATDSNGNVVPITINENPTTGTQQ